MPEAIWEKLSREIRRRERVGPPRVPCPEQPGSQGANPSRQLRAISVPTSQCFPGLDPKSSPGGNPCPERPPRTTAESLGVHKHSSPSVFSGSPCVCHYRAAFGAVSGALFPLFVVFVWRPRLPEHKAPGGFWCARLGHLPRSLCALP